MQNQNRFFSLMSSVCFSLALVCLFGVKEVSAESLLEPSPKNIIYIMLDDADFSDFSFNNHLIDDPDAVTPHMQWLRDNGNLLTNFYSGSAVCTPTRISVLTGNNPLRYGAYDPWPDVAFVSNSQKTGGVNGVPNTVPQMGVLMQKVGKKTGHFGKWHVGSSRLQYRHQSLGYDEHTRYVTVPKPMTGWHGEYTFETQDGTYKKDVAHVDLEFSLKMREFIDTYADHPEGFYVNFWPLTPHYPWAPPRDYENTENFDLDTQRGQVLGMMHAIDTEIGKLIQLLEDKGILHETMIVLTSDNGGASLVDHPEAYLNGDKGNLFEGGTRVSAVAFWPGGIAPSSTNDSVITTYDLMPTFLDMIDHPDYLQVEEIVDGDSKRTAFESEQTLDHKPILWELSGGAVRKDDQRTYAMRKDNLKIVKISGRNVETHANPYFLFDLENDPQGKINIAARNPILVDSLVSEMNDMRKSISKVDIIPEEVTSPIRVPFDPRLDISSKDLTLTFDLEVPATGTERPIKRLWLKPGTHMSYLMPNNTIRWRLIGSDDSNKPITTVLSTPVLSPGINNITLSVNGYRNDDSVVDLFVNDELVDSTLLPQHEVDLANLWSTISDLNIGSEGITMSNIGYYLVKFDPSDL